MRSTLRALAGLAATLLATSCASAPVAPVGGGAPAPGRDAARYKVLTALPVCTCNAAFAGGGAFNAVAFDTFLFRVVDAPSGDLSFVQVFVGAVGYAGSDENVVIDPVAGTVTITGTLQKTFAANPGPATIDVVIFQNTTTGAFSLTINGGTPIIGTSLTGFGLVPGSCELPGNVIILPTAS